MRTAQTPGLNDNREQVCMGWAEWQEIQEETKPTVLKENTELIIENKQKKILKIEIQTETHSSDHFCLIMICKKSKSK